VEQASKRLLRERERLLLLELAATAQRVQLLAVHHEGEHDQ
jgi:hypothetical protein